MIDVNEINIFGQQNSGNIEPTLDMTTTLIITLVEVQYWDGTAWVDVEGGNISNSNKVWIQLKLTSPIRTNKIRLNFSSNSGGWIRIIELEAWGTASK